MRTFLSITVALVVLISTATAWAQKIAVARIVGDDKIANRLNAELSALGFEIEIVEPDPASELHTLRQIAAEHGAMAGLRASPSKTGIELWVADPRTGRTAAEEVVTVDSGRNDELLALRAVEVLRARLLKLGVRSVVPQEAIVQPPIRESTPEVPTGPQQHEAVLLSADLGASYAYHTSALTNHELIHVGVSVFPHRNWSASLFTLLPLRPAELSKAAGTASVNSTLLALGSDAVIQKGWFRASLGAGTALVVLDVDGQARFPYEGRHQRLLTALPFVRAGGAAGMLERVLLRLDLLFGMSMPKPTIRINGQQVASWGRPLLMGTLSMELGVLTVEP